jgi:hypothetical protein
MKSRIIKISLLFFFAAVAMNADAQRRGSRRGSTPPAGQDNQQQQTNNTQPPSGYNPYGNIPNHCGRTLLLTKASSATVHRFLTST